MTKQAISTKHAPQAVGAYSQAIRVQQMVFISGQIGLLPESGKLISPDVTSQTEQVLRNLDAILEASGSSRDRVVKTTIYLANIDDFQMVNRIYAGHFASDILPARAVIGVSALPLGARVEIDAIAEAEDAD